MPLYDYLYVDLPKVISLYSQITGGVVEVRESTVERSNSSDNKRNYDFKVFRHDAGGTEKTKNGIKEIIKPHHALLSELEKELVEQGYLLDVSRDFEVRSLRDPSFRALLSQSLCVKITGRVVIEDYDRIKGVARTFPDVAKFINKSIESNICGSDEFKLAKQQLESLAQLIKHERDRNARATKEAEHRELKTALDKLLRDKVILQVDGWILDGVQTWIDTFLPGIINLRVYPRLDSTDEQFVGHLKREYFEDCDQASFHFTYGSMPTEPLSVIGVITSIPRESEDEFKPLAEFSRDGLVDGESFENAFRGMFRGFDGIEQIIRTCRYPRVMIQPLIVYRSVESNHRS